MPSPKLQTWKRVHLLNNQTKTPNGVKTFTFIGWEPPLACLAWKMLITDGREVNWQFCWKQRQSGLVPFKSCKLESKTTSAVHTNISPAGVLFNYLHFLVRDWESLLPPIFSCDGEWMNTRPENNPLSMEDIDHLLSFHERSRHTKRINF